MERGLIQRSTVVGGENRLMSMLMSKSMSSVGGRRRFASRSDLFPRWEFLGGVGAWLKAAAVTKTRAGRGERSP